MAVTKVTTKVLADDAVTIDKIADAALVTETEGISSNDNDTTLPTSAAVKDYVDTQDATKEDTITGAATTITSTDLTASKALVSNASGKVAASTVTDTELGYVSGVTSSIQDQFDALTDTTYTIAAADGDNTDEEKIVLTGTDSTTDTIVLEAGTGLSISRTGDKITFTNTVTDTDTVLTAEQVEDIVGAMVSSNSESGISVTYDDTNGKLDFSVTSQTDENFTSALKSKLDGIAAGAEVNQNAFSTIAVSGQTSVNADSNTDTLTFAAGTGITLTTDAGTDTVTITSTATGSVTEAFKTIAVSGQNDVVADGATDTLTLAAGNNITLTTDDTTDTITIASTASGGGSGSVNVVTDQFTGDGSTTGFTLSNTVSDNDAVQVYLNGVYQNKVTGNYSISGTTLTFVTAPTNSTEIEVVHFISEAATSLNAVQKTGDGSTVTFDLGYTITDEKYTFVFIQGVYQEKSTYTTSGSNITFSTAPQNGYTIEVMVFGTSSISEGGGVSWDTTVKTAAFTAVAGKGYFVNTTSAAITVTLPSSPSAGDEVTIVDYAGTADTNNITITSSDNINGSSNDVLIDYERGGVSMVYVDSTQGWIAYNAANETATALTDVPNTVTVDYLVVAGGGGGGAAGAGSGGGGAGGLRTSYGSTSGGGASAETSLTLATSTNYTVTVGSGGSGMVNTGSSPGSNGNNSVFDTITSLGGGYGAGHDSSPAAASGGSGGGDDYDNRLGSGGSGTANQGYAGGSSSTIAFPYYGCGGGGAGGTGETNSGTDLAKGGEGLSVSITGTATDYASGGSGGSRNSSPVTARSGGGGDGASTTTNATNGTANTGGGGGGGKDGVDGGDGGSGVVIIRYPNTYTVTIGSGLTGSTATDGSDKVTTFTAGTGTISFS